MNLGKRVRFAPSPTGMLHLGGLRTALFNYLYARSTGREMILRIEDTDKARTVPGAMEDIMETLKWAGINYDFGPDKADTSGPFIQSQRLETYKKYSQHLVSAGKAFVDSGSVRFKRTGKGFNFRDSVYGEVPASADMQRDDPVIIKSDGFPTYHFANVVDDHLMDVGLVMRGMEWIPSTSLHLDLYEAMQWQPPQFAHLPLLIKRDGSKLSKRQKDAFVEYYRKTKDVLPSALTNFGAQVGWTPLIGQQEKVEEENEEKMQEVMEMGKMIERFRLEDLNKSAAMVDEDKLMWFNRKHLPKASVELALRTGHSEQYCKEVLQCMRDRADTLTNLLLKAPYFFDDSMPTLLDEYEGHDIQALVKGIKDKKAFRMELTGSTVGPPLSDLIRVLLLKRTNITKSKAI